MSLTDNKDKATSKQLRYLHALYRAAGFDKDQYMWMLEGDYGITSTKELTVKQASQLIQVMRNVVIGQDSLRATAKQCAFIRYLWLPIDYSKGANADAHLNAFISKRFNKQSPEELTKNEAIKLISMIKAMSKQAAKRAGKTTVLKTTTSCQHCGQEIMWVQLKSGERVPFDFEGSAEDRQATSFHNCKK